MSDLQLQELRRQVNAGDVTLHPQLDVAECRAAGYHSWDDVLSNFKWARVRMCILCLVVDSTRAAHIPSPPVFSFKSKKNKAHTIGVGWSAYHEIDRIHLRPALLALCGARVRNYPDPSIMLRDCANPVTCLNCLRKLECFSHSSVNDMPGIASRYLYAKLSGMPFDTSQG